MTEDDDDDDEKLSPEINQVELERRAQIRALTQAPSQTANKKKKKKLNL